MCQNLWGGDSERASVKERGRGEGRGEGASVIQ